MPLQFIIISTSSSTGKDIVIGNLSITRQPPIPTNHWTNNTPETFSSNCWSFCYSEHTFNVISSLLDFRL